MRSLTFKCWLFRTNLIIYKNNYGKEKMAQEVSIIIYVFIIYKVVFKVSVVIIQVSLLLTEIYVIYNLFNKIIN